jgi:hypothetical protein
LIAVELVSSSDSRLDEPLLRFVFLTAIRDTLWNASLEVPLSTTKVNSRIDIVRVADDFFFFHMGMNMTM